MATFKAQRLRLSFPLSLGALLFFACSGGEPADPGGNENYGDDYIGYKNQSVEGDSSPSGGLGSSGAYGTGGSPGGYGEPYAGDELGIGGGVADSGGASGMDDGIGGDLNARGIQSWSDPSRGNAPEENPFFLAGADTTSTFSIDADSGSYTLSRSALSEGQLPDREHVRVEEFLNYFHFHYTPPSGDKPLSLYSEVSAAPWNPERELLLLGVQGKELSLEDAPPINLVFLVDVSGSMSDPMKLPLLKKGLKMLAAQMRSSDRISIVSYAGQDSIVLEGAHGDDQDAIQQGLDSLSSGGSTNGAGGIQAAYALAKENFIEGGVNRVLLGTDGDFNVGISSETELKEFISTKRETGVYLSVYGFGGAYGGNYQDSIAEQLADNGNGVYYYIDSDEEARRAFVETATGSLFSVADDVKLQVEFNPEHVKAYRLIGYENRVLSDAGFADDSVDAGELGASTSVTALYEIIPASSRERVPEPQAGTIPMQVLAAEADNNSEPAVATLSGDDYVEIRLRYKESGKSESQLMTLVRGVDQRRQVPSHKFLFAAGVAEFAQLLRGSQYIDLARGEELVSQINRTRALDREGAISEARGLVEMALKAVR